ncbi:FAD-dependent oxidoreductase [Nocardia seriolae]|uniref:Fumarate reductase (Quinol) n=1 Tax=Nocardia seriolae TaxID=37332 RepID=A0ABC8B399_9NOCA|nr:FAD-dependent oxidoreductase [Nocardia seriolae]APB00842.1 Fumarate reductase (quinol) [Nocardia seriolae]MTJ65391.1 FAD-dependent oxidoreductase [Nocardia seriolae]MTJ75175.1 FAD-dependent oxidoreductase [Nocardia seriolae]MTJ90276.1 FAD-dependent oxidoreductase [Nocardia seriolae]MTK34239.1 FAD-dependent oxidoreductase [Nocardia seriolae]
MTVRNSVTPRAAGEVNHYDIETDVLVVGYGAAGASAAFAAAHAGARVLVLDRSGGAGGASAMSGGEIYLGGGTPIQVACGYEDSPEEMAAFLTAALGAGADPAKIEEYCAGSVEHFHWLVDRGVPFKPTMWDAPTWVPPTDDGLMWLGENSWPFTESAVPAPRGHRPAAKDFGGKLLMECLSSAAESAGATTLFDTYVSTLIVADDGTVVGVVARNYGKELTIRAPRGIVLTTGGFVDNDDMLAAHAPQLLGHNKVSAGTDDGSGIRMAQALGAAVRHMSAGQVGMSLIPGLAARGLVVNALGRRFINEDTYPGRIGQHALYRQNMGGSWAGDDTAVWVIVDEHGFDDVPEPQRWGVQPTHVAETPAELESLAGLPPGSLVATLTRYNEFATRAEDPDHHKSSRWLRPLTAPLAAIDVKAGIRPPAESGNRRGTGASVFTLGGLHTDLDGHVLDLDARPIPGLFAAGRAANGLHGFGYISGTSLGDGTFFGRRAGASAARRT